MAKSKQDIKANKIQVDEIESNVGNIVTKSKITQDGYEVYEDYDLIPKWYADSLGSYRIPLFNSVAELSIGDKDPETEVILAGVLNENELIDLYLYKSFVEEDYWVKVLDEQTSDVYARLSNNTFTGNQYAPSFIVFRKDGSNYGRWLLDISDSLSNGQIQFRMTNDAGYQKISYSIDRESQVVDFAKTPTVNGVTLLDSGSYTPSTSNLDANVTSASSLRAANYIRVGNIVNITASFSVVISPNQQGVASFRFSLPNFDGLNASSVTGFGDNISIGGPVGNAECTLAMRQPISTTAGSRTIEVNLSYSLIPV